MPSTVATKQKIATWFVTQGAADVRWRAEMPAKHVGAKLVIMNEKQGKKYLTTPNDGKLFPWHETVDGAEYPGLEGTVVWTRPCMVRAMHGAAMAANGYRVVSEVDDNYLSAPDQNYFMRVNKYDAKGRKSHMHAFATMDAIICSTEWLRDEYTKTFKKELGYAPDMHVARNHVDAMDWGKRLPLLPPSEGRVRVGWMGSHQHIWDLRLAAPALHLAKELGAEIVFVGLDPAEHDPEWAKFLGDYTHIPWFAPKDYHKTLLNFEIGIIPLVYNKHTLGKSDVKYLEYSMSGAATVAQNMPVYNKTIKHGETGLLAGSPDEMAFAVADLIRNARYRKELAEAAKQYVLEERTIQKNKHEWEEPIRGA